jgi:dTDP-4-dehydrorhamnose 3,5-epimerase
VGAASEIAITPLAIPGCYELQPTVRPDARGSFVKTFHKEAFQERGLVQEFAEEYFTFSHQGVLRGMHFQVPPHDHTKIVCAATGRVIDVLVDLRKGSPSFGTAAALELSASKANMVYIARGVAHGFYAQEEALLFYKVTSVYAAPFDKGVRWDSFGFQWPSFNPILSDRDRQLPALRDFNSPF